MVKHMYILGFMSLASLCSISMEGAEDAVGPGGVPEGDPDHVIPVEENVETTDARINPNLDPDHAKADDQASEIDPDFVEEEEEVEGDDESEVDPDVNDEA